MHGRSQSPRSTARRTIRIRCAAQNSSKSATATGLAGRVSAQSVVYTSLRSLPPLHNSLVQFQTDNIGSYRYDRFGDYGRYRLGRLGDPQVQQALAGFHGALQAVQAQIEHDNHAVRSRPYVYLLPDAIPNSINI